MLVAAGQGLATNSSPENIRAVVRACSAAYFEFAQQHGDRWDVLFGSGATVDGPSPQQVLRLRFETAALLAATIQRGAPDADSMKVEGFAHAASGAGNQLAVWWRKNPNIPIDRVIDISTEFMWSGILGLTEIE